MRSISRMSGSSSFCIFIITALSLLLTSTVDAQGDASYLVLAPKTVRRGADYTVSVNILHASRDVRVRTELRDANNDMLVSNTTTVASGTTETAILKMPRRVTGTACTLLVSGSQGLTFSNNASVEIKKKTLSLFVQTDKAIYKPGQKVMFRVIAVHPNLRPYKNSMDIAIYDSAGNRIVQMLDQGNSTGVVSGDLQLSDHTVLGEWKIKVAAAGNEYEKVFEVAEYVLPKFKVSVDHPPYLLLNLKRPSRQSALTFSVTAKYTYGQPVNGQADIYVQLAPSYAYDSTVYPKKHYTATLKQGRASVTMPLDEIVKLVPSDYSDAMRSLQYRSILIIANVTELATGKTLSGNSTVRCHAQQYDLKFMDMTPDNYKPGLDFTGYMQLSLMNGSPPRAEDVNGLVTLSVTTRMYGGTPDVSKKLDLVIPESGIIPFTLSLSEHDSSSVSLNAVFNDRVTDLTVSAYKTLAVFESRDNQSIQVSANLPDGAVKRGETVQFTVRTTEPIRTYFYELLSKGVIVLADTPPSSDAKHSHRFSLTFDDHLAQLLSPNARVVVWYATSAGEIITDSLEFSVDAAFANEVSLSFSNSEVRPGDKLSLTVGAHRGSYVGVLAVDQSVLLLKGGNDITQNMVMDELRQYDSSDDRGCGGGPIMIDRRRRKRSVCSNWYWPSSSGGSASQDVFDNAGVVVMTDGFVHETVYHIQFRSPDIMFDINEAAVPQDSDVVARRPTSAKEPTRVRVEFPETWLWSESTAGPDGRVSMQVMAPDTITSWVASAFAVSHDVGLGVAADTARLTVFKQFFLSLNLPYAIIRGEEFGLQVTVYNYLSSDQQVTVTLSKSSDFKVRHQNAVEPESADIQQTVKVGAKDAASAYFWIVPESLGQIPIEAKAVSNGAGDAVRRQLLVKPEGTQLEYSTSVFVDLTESSPYRTTLNVALPDDVVSGSEIVELTALGDMLGPSVNGLDKLIKMPYGCGEQNMLNFAPNIYIRRYLETTGQLTNDIVDKSQRYMMAGYQRELTYQRRDGSFSAFGNSDPAGSIWLSAFVAKCFHEAKDYIAVDEEKVGNTTDWIIKHQAQSGSFQEPPEGRVIHTDMQGGASQGVALTAYVLISLLENRRSAPSLSATTRRLDQAIEKAVSFLENQLTTITSDPYALNIIGYALTLAGSSEASAAMNRLSSLAIVEGGTTHWQKDTSSDTETAGDVWRPPYTQSRSVDIEMTAYALLVYSHNRDMSNALPIAKWIIAQRNPNGGFSSTQDTVVALQALAQFASLTVMPSGDNVGLELTATYGVESHSFSTISRQNALLLQTLQLPSTIDRVNIEASGSGTALVQLNVKYNVLSVNDDNGIELSTSTTEENRLLRLRTCARWTKQDQPSGMVVMEVNQVTGYSSVDLDDVKRQVGTALKRVEDSDDKMILYFDELIADETCVTLTSEKTLPVSNVQQVPIKVYAYYDPRSADTEFYGPSMASAQTDPSKECPGCFGLPVRPLTTGNTGTQSTATQLIITFTLAALLSYLFLA